MLRSVLLKSLRDGRRAFAWWSVGLVGLVAMIVSVYPSIRDNPGLNKLIEDYPEALKGFIAFGGEVDYASAAGYLGSELFSLMIPLLFLVAAIANGAGAIAGEEERGTLELLLANPVSRRRIVVEKAAALSVELVALGAVLWLALWAATRLAGMDIAALHLGAAVVSALLLAFLFGGLALALGAAVGRRSVAIGVSAALAVLTFFVHSLAPLVDAFDTISRLSPFYHYAASDPLRRGLELGHVAFLAALGAATVVAAVVAFDRRDVGV
jgi:beta-exotoxin I transport system permease protein